MIYKFQNGGVSKNPLSHLDETPLQTELEKYKSDLSPEEIDKYLDEYFENYKFDPDYDEYAKEYNRRQKFDDTLTIGGGVEDSAQVVKTALGVTSKIPYAYAVTAGIGLGNDLKQAYLKYKMGEKFTPDMVEGLFGILPFKTKLKIDYFKNHPNLFFNFLKQLSNVTGNWLVPVIQQTTHWQNPEREQPDNTKYLFGGNLPLIAKSGIKIKEKNKGKFTKSAKEHGMGVQEYANKVINDPNATPLQRKRANFVINAKKWK